MHTCARVDAQEICDCSWQQQRCQPWVACADSERLRRRQSPAAQAAASSRTRGRRTVGRASPSHSSVAPGALECVVALAGEFAERARLRVALRNGWLEGAATWTQPTLEPGQAGRQRLLLDPAPLCASWAAGLRFLRCLLALLPGASRPRAESPVREGVGLLPAGARPQHGVASQGSLRAPRRHRGRHASGSRLQGTPQASAARTNTARCFSQSRQPPRSPCHFAAPR